VAHKIKIVTVVGARPQFIKASVFSRKLKDFSNIEEMIIHTGQHYDYSMSEIFFDELKMPKPAINLGIGSLSHGGQTGKMIEEIEKHLLSLDPDWLILYGDTNSTLAGAIAASKIPKIKIAHIEAGLRSYNREMPEEINRILTDHASHILFAPTKNAINILEKEGLGPKAIFSGDIMFDSTLYNLKLAKQRHFTQPEFPYFLATIHRQENTNDLDRLEALLNILEELPQKTILPLHPRTKSKLNNLSLFKNIVLLDPLGPLDFISYLKNAEMVLTDSGGVQKEAFFLRVPCITLRNETEWIETLEDNWNVITGSDKEKIWDALSQKDKERKIINPFGDGDAAKIIIEKILDES
jgi:UDP-N-acetylglucosamine 2-epimerase